MAQVLYASDHVKPSKAHLVGIFYWIASLKQYFASQFPNFYKPANNTDNNLIGNGQPDIYRQLRDFLADNIGQEFTGLVAQSLDDTYRRYHH